MPHHQRKGQKARRAGCPLCKREPERTLLTVEDVARLLAVKPSTVYEWVRSGTMPHYRLGPRAIRFDVRLLSHGKGDGAHAGDRERGRSCPLWLPQASHGPAMSRMTLVIEATAWTPIVS
jgi:excisionase family DNA binding protein